MHSGLCRPYRPRFDRGVLRIMLFCMPIFACPPDGQCLLGAQFVSLILAGTNQ